MKKLDTYMRSPPFLLLLTLEVKARDGLRKVVGELPLWLSPTCHRFQTRWQNRNFVIENLLGNYMEGFLEIHVSLSLSTLVKEFSAKSHGLVPFEFDPTTLPLRWLVHARKWRWPNLQRWSKDKTNGRMPWLTRGTNGSVILDWYMGT